MEEFKIDITEKIAHIEESLKSAHKRINSIDELTKSVYELASSVKFMQNSVTEMSERLKIVEERPLKKWDLIITAVTTSVLSLVLGYLFRVVTG